MYTPIKTTPSIKPVRRCARQFGMKPVHSEHDPFTLYWLDGAVPFTKLLELEPYQRINHFPGMHQICKKDCLARNLMRMYKVFGKVFGFAPKTWHLSGE